MLNCVIVGEVWSVNLSNEQHRAILLILLTFSSYTHPYFNIFGHNQQYSHPLCVKGSEFQQVLRKVLRVSFQQQYQVVQATVFKNKSLAEVAELFLFIYTSMM